jgi:hypothetical protein
MKMYNPIGLGASNIKIFSSSGDGESYLSAHAHTLLDHVASGGVYLVKKNGNLRTTWELHESSSEGVRKLTELDLRVNELEHGKVHVTVRDTPKRFGTWHDPYKYVATRPLNLYFPNGNGPRDNAESQPYEGITREHWASMQLIWWRLTGSSPDPTKDIKESARYMDSLRRLGPITTTGNGDLIAERSRSQSVVVQPNNKDPNTSGIDRIVIFP